MRLSLDGFNEDQFRWCFWAAGSDGPGSDAEDGGSTSADTGGSSDGPGGSDDADSMDSRYDTSSVGMGTNTMGGEGDGGSVDRVAVASPNTGRVNTQNFNTSAAQTAGMNRVNVGGQTIAVSQSAVNAVAAGRGGSSPVTNAIQSQIVGPAQALDQAQRAANLSSTFRGPIGTTTAAISPSPVGFSYDPYAGTVLDRAFLSRPSPELPSMSAMDYGYSMGIPSPVNLPNAYFDDGKQRAYFSPATGTQTSRLSFYDQAPTPDSQKSFFDRAFTGFKQAFADTPQAMTQYTIDPSTGLPVQAGPAMYKSSENVAADIFGNLLVGATGMTPFLGAVDTQTYMPYSGGTYTDPVTGEVVGTPRESYQYATSTGGLLSGLVDGQLTPMSEIEARQAQMGGDGGSDQPLIIPQGVAEVDPVTGEPTAFPAFTPRQFEYEPYVGKFYTIPSRFTKPYGLLG